MKNIAVFFGGVSQERDVSVLTGVLTLNSLDKTLFNAIPVFIDEKGTCYTGDLLKKVGFFKNYDRKKLKKVTLLIGENFLFFVEKGRLKKAERIDCAINCLHGRNGEDGSLSGLLRLCRIPLASPDIFSSASSMDKIRTKIVLKGLNILSADYLPISRRDYYENKDGTMDNIETLLGLPVIIKPSSSGSSIGISVARERDALFSGLEKAFVYDNSVLVERYLDGAEDINCAAMRVRDKIVVSECERPIHGGEILSFSDKYTSSKTGEMKEFPAKIDKKLSDEIKKITKDIYLSFGFSGVIRVDYLICDDIIYLNEINGVPGSLSYYLFSPKLSDFKDNLTALIEQGIKEELQFEGCRFDYESDVLSFKGVAIKK